MQPIRANHPRNLGMRFLQRIKSHDIQLALDDGTFEYGPSNSNNSDFQWEWLRLSETLGYHRQLFFWRLHPLLWAFSQTATSHTTTLKHGLDIGN